MDGKSQHERKITKKKNQIKILKLKNVIFEMKKSLDIITVN